MRPSVTRPKLFLAILALLVAIFACTALLRAQNLPQKHEPYTRQQHCSASKWAALRGGEDVLPWSSSGMQPCKRPKKLHHVTCIVVRGKGNSDPFRAG